MIITDEVYEKLKKANDDGFKMVIVICRRCEWERGFAFDSDGSLWIDPGCFCNGNTKSRPGRRRDMEKAVERIPGLLQKWFYDAELRKIERAKQGAEIAKYRAEQKERIAKLFEPEKPKETNNSYSPQAKLFG